MSRSVKFAISIPDNEFKELEAFRKKNAMSRSKLVLEAFRLWKETMKREKSIKTYVKGYKRMPEKLAEIEAWQKASVGTFSPEEW